MFIKMDLPRRLLVGLSGGADSVALAWLLRRQEGLELRAVHVNHGLRGADADADEAFVRELCAAWQLPLDVYRAQPPHNPGEDWARQARYGFFRQAMEKHRAEAVALAHHRDDQAETMLLHLMRGAGLTGLAGMPEDSEVLGVRVVRPLLGCSRQALRDLLVQEGLPWREDASNRDTRYLRNAVRHELLPLMERLAPGAGERIAAAAELLRQDERVLDRLTHEALRMDRPWLSIGELKTLPDGMLQRVLRLWWQRHAQQDREERGLCRAHTEALAALMHSPAGSRCNLPGDCHGYRGWTHLHLLGVRQELPAITPEVSDGAGTPGNGKTMQAMPKKLYQQCTVRTRRTGDWIRPFGQDGRQTLQDYMINKRVDAPFRDAVPLLCRGSEVLLAAGVGAGHVPPFDPNEENVMLTWLGEMPWLQN